MPRERKHVLYFRGLELNVSSRVSLIDVFSIKCVNSLYVRDFIMLLF